MTEKQLGLALIVTDAGRLLGTFTDGDLRRIFERVDNPRSLDARRAYERSRRPSAAPTVQQSTVGPQYPAVECLLIMRASRITALVVLDEDERPCGVLRLLDLIEAGLG